MLAAWKNVRKPVIGMLHLAALPGSPLYGGSLSVVREAVLRDAKLLAEGGVNGLMI
jgi:predicted TIM-barrel enzyme